MDEVLRDAELAAKERKEGTHKHRCPKCQCIWEHPNDLGEREDAGKDCKDYDQNHLCPKCGTDQRYKYHGEDPVNYKHVKACEYECVKEVQVGKV